jgi:hypothetical protein
MHPALIAAHTSMLPRLRAEEEMRTARATALGSGTMKKHDARHAWRDLEREARGSGLRGRPASEQDLAAAGMGVRRVRRD